MGPTPIAPVSTCSFYNFAQPSKQLVPPLLLTTYRENSNQHPQVMSPNFIINFPSSPMNQPTAGTPVITFNSKPSMGTLPLVPQRDGTSAFLPSNAAFKTPSTVAEHQILRAVKPASVIPFSMPIMSTLPNELRTPANSISVRSSQVLSERNYVGELASIERTPDRQPLAPTNLQPQGFPQFQLQSNTLSKPTSLTLRQTAQSQIIKPELFQQHQQQNKIQLEQNPFQLLHIHEQQML
jgi:hypothetical protein